MRVLEGTQPLLTQVPPTFPLSISAVFRPAETALKATPRPTSPAPTTITSYFFKCLSLYLIQMHSIRCKISLQVYDKLHFTAKHNSAVCHGLVPFHSIIFTVDCD